MRLDLHCDIILARRLGEGGRSITGAGGLHAGLGTQTALYLNEPDPIPYGSVPVRGSKLLASDTPVPAFTDCSFSTVEPDSGLDGRLA